MMLDVRRKKSEDVAWLPEPCELRPTYFAHGSGSHATPRSNEKSPRGVTTNGSRRGLLGCLVLAQIIEPDDALLDTSRSVMRVH